MSSSVEQRTRQDPAPGTRGGASALRWHDGLLFRDGSPTSIRSGSMHYFRVHPGQWRDRMRRLVDLGLDTVDTYIPWNFHRRLESDAADFTGWRDVGSFVEAAADAGLDVILRPGPYICAEWTNGGLPAWLTGRGVTPRSSDPRFLGPVAEWFDELLPRLTPFQASLGGPVIAFQVENEFGSFGDDVAYVGWVAEALRARGVTEMLYTADGPTDVMLDGGSLPRVLSAITLGSKPQQAKELLAARRPDSPFFCAEFWGGWFDHWGDPHHVRDPHNATENLAGILADGGSASIYMAHGGTNFGLWAGANRVDGALSPTATSYDSDAPIAEDGTLTEKFFAMREVLSPGAAAPVSTQPLLLDDRVLATRAGASLDAALTALASRAEEQHAAPPRFEDLGLDSGLVRYRATTPLPDREVSLTFERVADLAIVVVDGVRVGTVRESGTIAVRGHGRPAGIEVIVESLGRVNYGPALGEPKGLLGGVLVDERRLVQRWTAEPVDLQAADPATLAALTPEGGPGTAGVATARLDVDEPGDTHLALPGFTRGLAWVNGFLLGRYWNVGPQQTLYVPAPLLRAGRNEIVVLDLEGRGDELRLRRRPELGPEEQYIEEF